MHSRIRVTEGRGQGIPPVADAAASFVPGPIVPSVAASGASGSGEVISSGSDPQDVTRERQDRSMASPATSRVRSVSFAPPAA